MTRSPAPADDALAPPRILGWRLVAVGVLAGLASGLFGVGGGVVIVPGLVMVAAFDQRRAHGTSLAAIVAITATGAIGYATAGQVDVAVAACLTVGALAGAAIGIRLLARVPQRALRWAFAGLLCLTAVRMVLGTGVGDGRGAIDLLTGGGYVVTGLAAGTTAGLLGVGGGVVMVPLLTLAFGFPLVLAKGTALAVITPTALTATVGNLRRGTADLRSAAVVGLSGVATAAIASQISLGLDPTVSAWSFAALLVVVAARMLRQRAA